MVYKRIVDDKWSFRDANTKEYSHCYHAYPAMMIPQVARTLINLYKPRNVENVTLFDPYMGSGTSLVEANLAGINAIGTDLNPLARLMSEVKTNHYDIGKLTDGLNIIQDKLFFYSPNNVINKDFDRISNYAFWYTKDNLLKLSYLQQCIDELEYGQKFYKLVLSEVVREVSFTRNGEFKRFKMSANSLKNFHPDPFGLFEKKFQRNIYGLSMFNKDADKAFSSAIYDFNSSVLIPEDIISPSSIDIIVTSPPYGDSRTTVAYGQFSRWANEWFCFENAKDLDSKLMGGGKTHKMSFQTDSIQEQLNLIANLDEKRYWEVISFLNDYYNSINNVAKVVRKGGVVCYVVGNRNVKGTQIPLDYFTAEMFEKQGFEHEITIVRNIPNKRMPSKTSPTNVTGEKVSTMTNEYIVILHKK